jgi:hypothetical protein
MGYVNVVSLRIPENYAFLVDESKNMQTARNLYWEWGLCLLVM